MKNGFVYIIAILFVTAFSSFVAYDSEKARSSRSALGVILLASLVSLIVNYLGDIKNLSYADVPEYDHTAEEAFAEQSVENAFIKGIESELIRKFSFLDKDIEVTCTDFDFETVSAEKINVCLSGAAAYADIRAVRGHVENSGLGECEVIVLFE